MTLEERFWSKVDVREEDECWEWHASRNPEGYGRFKFNGSSTGAHRIAWMLAIGKIPPGIFCCHHCDNPPCCNPAHLFLGTHNDNMHDMNSKGRRQNQQGEHNNNAVLAQSEVLQICRLLDKANMFQREIGALFGVSHDTIRAINTGENWGWLTGRGA